MVRAITSFGRPAGRDEEDRLSWYPAAGHAARTLGCPGSVLASLAEGTAWMIPIVSYSSSVTASALIARRARENWCLGCHEQGGKQPVDCRRAAKQDCVACHIKQEQPFLFLRFRITGFGD